MSDVYPSGYFVGIRPGVLSFEVFSTSEVISLDDSGGKREYSSGVELSGPAVSIMNSSVGVGGDYGLEVEGYPSEMFGKGSVKSRSQGRFRTPFKAVSSELFP